MELEEPGYNATCSRPPSVWRHVAGGGVAAGDVVISGSVLQAYIEPLLGFIIFIHCYIHLLPGLNVQYGNLVDYSTGENSHQQIHYLLKLE